MRYLTFALTKGRIAKKTLELLEQLGITCEEMKDKDSRKLIFVNEELKLKFFLAKGGQKTKRTSSEEPVRHGRGSKFRTHGTRFWRPLLYQLSYTPIYIR